MKCSRRSGLGQIRQAIGNLQALGKGHIWAKWDTHPEMSGRILESSATEDRDLNKILDIGVQNSSRLFALRIHGHPTITMGCGTSLRILGCLVFGIMTLPALESIRLCGCDSSNPEDIPLPVPDLPHPRTELLFASGSVCFFYNSRSPRSLSANEETPEGTTSSSECSPERKCMIAMHNAQCEITSVVVRSSNMQRPRHRRIRTLRRLCCCAGAHSDATWLGRMQPTVLLDGSL
jgi:hypothetical protein